MGHWPSHRTRYLLAILIVSTVVWVTICVLKFHAITKNNPERHPPNENARLVLILAYMRGGSSFAGKLFDANHDAFYVFEPLYHIYERALKHPNFMKTVAKSNGPPPVHENATLFAKDLLHSYLACNIPKIPVINFYNIFLNEGSRTKELVSCDKTNSECIRKLTLSCKESKIRAIKTIRMRMSDVSELLDRLPSLKVVHLLRDPRGIISSRKKHFGNYKKIGHVFQDAEKLCQDILSDMTFVDLHRGDFPGRFLTVLYEGLAERPEEVSAQVYDFIKSPQPPSVRQWIRNNTRAETDEELRSFIGTMRRNSSVTAYAWRSVISLHLTKFMDQKCQGVYKRTGYLPAYNLSVLKDFRISLRDKLAKQHFIS